MPARLSPAQPAGGADVIARAMGARSHGLAWAAAGAVAVMAMSGYLLTRALPGGFLGDHGDVGNWRCPLGITALSVETLIILLVPLAAWLGRSLAASPAAQVQPAARHAPEYS